MWPLALGGPPDPHRYCLASLRDKDLATLSALIIDGHPQALDALAHRLSTVGGVHVVASTATVPAAIDAARRLQPSVIICDVRMRDADGSALVRALASLPHAPAIVVHTSFLDDRERRELAEAGAAAFVLKEAGLRALLACVDAIRAAAEGA